MNDTISRQDMIDVLAKDKEMLEHVLDDMDVFGYERKKYEYGLGLIESYILNVMNLPSVQPERKTGKWIYDGDGCICNQCKSAFSWWADSQTTNCCPNCGTPMTEVEQK